MSVQKRRLVFIKHAHLYAMNNDTFQLLYIHLLVHVYWLIYIDDGNTPRMPYGQRHPFESRSSFNVEAKIKLLGLELWTKVATKKDKDHHRQ